MNNIHTTPVFQCHCTARYSGKNCEIDIGPPCRSNPCYNSGKCIEDSRGDYVCNCLVGYTGSHCETEITINPLCENKPCLNDGICKVIAGTSKIECDCAEGYTGTRCEVTGYGFWVGYQRITNFFICIFDFQVNEDDCESNPCQNNGICIDEVAGFHCNCSHTGYTGALCENNENECKKKPNICLNGGVCYDTYGSYICECLPNFSGFNCEVLIDPCFAHACKNGGTCINRRDSFQCICPRGFSGEMCETGPDLGTECIAGKCCEPDVSGMQCKTMLVEDCNCLNGGRCNRNTSACVCPQGFDGTLCENDVDECIQNQNICVHGICVNQPGTFKCYCEPGNSQFF